MYAFLHFTFASGIGVGHAGSLSHSAEFSFLFNTCVKECQESECMYVRESEIDRQNRVRIGRLSDREAGKRVQIHYLVPHLFILYVVLPRGAIPYPSVP